jgi:hypothetical protein
LQSRIRICPRTGKEQRVDGKIPFGLERRRLGSAFTKEAAGPASHHGVNG